MVAWPQKIVAHHLHLAPARPPLAASGLRVSTPNHSCSAFASPLHATRVLTWKEILYIEVVNASIQRIYSAVALVAISTIQLKIKGLNQSPQCFCYNIFHYIIIATVQITLCTNFATIHYRERFILSQNIIHTACLRRSVASRWLGLRPAQPKSSACL